MPARELRRLQNTLQVGEELLQGLVTGGGLEGSLRLVLEANIKVGVDISHLLIDLIEKHKGKDVDAIQEFAGKMDFGSDIYKKYFYDLSLKFANEGDLEALRVINEFGFDLTFKPSVEFRHRPKSKQKDFVYETSLLHEASLDGNIEILGYILDLCKKKNLKIDDYISRTNEGNLFLSKVNPLFFAMIGGDEEAVNLLIENGASLSSRDDEIKILVVAANAYNFKGALAFLKKIKEEKGDAYLKSILDIRINLKTTPGAIEYGGVDKMSLYIYLLLAKRTDEERSEVKEEVIKKEEANKVELVRFMLENGLEPNEKYDGLTAFHISLSSKNPQIVDLMIEFGADISFKNDEKKEYKVQKIDEDGKRHSVVKSIEQKRSCANYAARHSSFEVFNELVMQGLNLGDDLHSTEAVEYSAISENDDDRINRSKKLRYIYRHGGNFEKYSRVDSVPGECYAPLHSLGIDKQDRLDTDFLLAQGINPRILSNKCFEPLSFAIKYGNYYAVTKFVEAGANLDVNPEYGAEAPLIAAIKSEQEPRDDIFRYLLCNGADLKAVYQEVENVISHFKELAKRNKDKGKEEALNNIKLLSLRFSSPAGHETSVLHDIAEIGNWSTFEKYQNDFDLDVKQKNKNGKTPLDIALEKGNESVILGIIQKMSKEEKMAKLDEIFASFLENKIKTEHKILLRTLAYTNSDEEISRKINEIFLNALEKSSFDDVSFFFSNDVFDLKDIADQAFKIALKRTARDMRPLVGLFLAKGLVEFDEQKIISTGSPALASLRLAIAKSFTENQKTEQLDFIIQRCEMEAGIKLLTAKLKENFEFFEEALIHALENQRKDLALKILEIGISSHFNPDIHDVTKASSNKESALRKAIKVSMKQGYYDFAMSVCSFDEKLYDEYFIEIYGLLEGELEINDNDFERLRKNFIGIDQLERKADFINFFLMDSRVKNRHIYIEKLFDELREQYEKEQNEAVKGKIDSKIEAMMVNAIERSGNLEVLEIIKKHFNHVFQRANNHVAFVKAVLVDNIDSIRFLENSFGKFFNSNKETEEKRWQIINKAVLLENCEEVTRWIFDGFDFSKIEEFGIATKQDMAIHLESFIFRNPLAAKLMIKGGVNPNWKTQEQEVKGTNNVIKYAKRGDLRAVKFLMDNGAEFISCEKDLVEIAIDTSNSELVKLLMFNQVNFAQQNLEKLPESLRINYNRIKENKVEEADENGNYLIHLYCAYATQDTLENFFRKLSDDGLLKQQLLLRNATQSTVLHCAISKGNLATSEFLIKEGCEIEARDRTNFTPLYVAAEQLDFEAVKFLLKKGAKLNYDDGNGQSFFEEFFKTSLLPAIKQPQTKRNAIEMFKLLLANGACFKAQMDFDYSQDLDEKHLREVYDVVEAFKNPQAITAKSESRVDLFNKYNVGASAIPNWKDLQKYLTEQEQKKANNEDLKNQNEAATTIQAAARTYLAKKDHASALKEHEEDKRSVHNFLQYSKQQGQDLYQKNLALKEEDESRLREDLQDRKAIKASLPQIKSQIQALLDSSGSIVEDLRQQEQEARVILSRNFESLAQKRRNDAELERKQQNENESRSLQKMLDERNMQVKEYLKQGRVNIKEKDLTRKQQQLEQLKKKEEELKEQEEVQESISQFFQWMGDEEKEIDKRRCEKLYKSLSDFIIKSNDVAAAKELLTKEKELFSEFLKEIDDECLLNCLFCKADYDKELCKMLIECGVDVNKMDNKEILPLHCAIINQDQEMIDALFEAGAKLDIPYRDKKTLEETLKEAKKHIDYALKPRKNERPSSSTRADGAQAASSQAQDQNTGPRWFF